MPYKYPFWKRLLKSFGTVLRVPYWIIMIKLWQRGTLGLVIYFQGLLETEICKYHCPGAMIWVFMGCPGPMPVLYGKNTPNPMSWCHVVRTEIQRQRPGAIFDTWEKIGQRQVRPVTPFKRQRAWIIKCMMVYLFLFIVATICDSISQRDLLTEMKLK